MILLFDSIKWILLVILGIVILVKGIPLITNISKEISKNNKERRQLERHEQHTREQEDRANADFVRVMEQITNVKCPDCGEPFPPEDLRPVCYCSFCGRKIEVQPSLIQDAMKYSNEAKNRQVERGKLKEEKKKNKRDTVILSILVVMVVAGVIAGMYTIFK